MARQREDRPFDKKIELYETLIKKEQEDSQDGLGIKYIDFSFFLKKMKFMFNTNVN